MNFFDKIKRGLSKTREQVFNQLQQVILFSRRIDDELLQKIEELLLSADVGVATSLEIISRVKQEVKRKNFQDSQELLVILKGQILQMFAASKSLNEAGIERPLVILVAGVNGTGKTTSIAKMAWRYRQQGQSVLLVAADTFRAAAIEQLQIWAERAGAELLKHQEGSDPAAVVFDALQAARSRKKDVVIIDTAGRLHTKANLMEELKKIRRVIQKVIPAAPHRTFLVLDATTGQNALVQARQFIEAVAVDGIILAKLDGTAKGGVVIGISYELKLPVEYVGLGEEIDDLEPFDPKLYLEGLFLSEKKE
jgi:fused signal recognition particle receptor